MPRPAEGPTSSTKLQLIRDKVRELAKAVTKLAIAPKAQSWAQIATLNLAAPLLTRSTHKILVFYNPEVQSYINRTIAEIISIVQSPQRGSRKIVGARKLLSKDIALVFKNSIAKEH